MRARLETHRPGDYVIRQGALAHSFLIVCRGLVLTSTVTESGNESLLDACGVGDYVGLVDWMQGRQVRSVSAQAMTNVSVVSVRVDELQREIAGNWGSIASVLRQIGIQHHRLERRLMLLANHDASGRVIHSLLEFARLLGVREVNAQLPAWLSHTMIAGYAGVRRETVSRLLAKLKRRRLIAVYDRGLTIPNLSSLESALGEPPEGDS